MAKNTTFNLGAVVDASDLDSYLPRVHHIIRVLSKDNTPTNGATPVSEANEYISSYVNDGWSLKETHYLGEVPEGYTILWVLTK